jgi:lycopene cyclase domain-containing protein
MSVDAFRQDTNRWKFGLPVAGLVLVLINWTTNTVQPDHLMTHVAPISPIKWLESKWLYAWLLAFTAFCPLVLGLLPKWKFYPYWRSFLIANLPVTAVFIIWDVYFARVGAWGFSDQYTTGLRLLGLPWEEWAFFVIVPAACAFIYTSLRKVYPTTRPSKKEQGLTIGLILFFLILAAVNWGQIYTATTAIGCAFFTAWHLIFVPNGRRGLFYATYLLSCLPFLLVNSALTGCFTSEPVVLYNPDEYLGFRIGTVPADDFMYSFLMLFGNIWGLESRITD